MNRPSLATLWLDGCSGCHMSILDMDEGILDVLGRVELVYSPLVDYKEFPEDVTLALVEGAVASEEDVALLERVRRYTRWLVALGDCAVTGNVPAMRNHIPLERLFQASYRNIEGLNGPIMPVTRLLPRVLPLNQVVAVDLFLPGCPPSAQVISRFFAYFFEALERADGDLDRVQLAFDATKYTGFGR